MGDFDGFQKCQFCGTYCSSIGGLKTHMKAVHSDIKRVVVKR